MNLPCAEHWAQGKFTLLGQCKALAHKEHTFKVSLAYLKVLEQWKETVQTIENPV